jgi:hypothetical protein
VFSLLLKILAASSEESSISIRNFLFMLANPVASNGEPSLRARRSQCARGDSKKRLLVLDLIQGKVLFHCLVSHDRSPRCPAIPAEPGKEIIHIIKGGSCLFIYVPETSCTYNSQIIGKITSITKVYL